MHNNSNWAPFNSVINGNEVILEVLDKKNKISKPILSEEMILDLERDILIFYQNQNEVLLKYYYKNQIKEFDCIITKLDPVNKKIIINNGISLYFANIISILEKN